MDNQDGIDIALGSLKIEGDASKLFEALAKAQAEFDAVPETSKGQIGKDRHFKYADFATLTKCTRPHLTKHGIVLLQPLHYEGGMAVTTTIIAGHGARIQSSFSFKADPNPQEFGRAHTYYRRYQLQGILGLEGEDADSVRQQEERSQFVDTKPAAVPAAKVEPKAPVKAPEQAKPAEPKPAEQPKPAGDSRSINARIVSAMKELKWSTEDLKAFYKAEIDKKGFDKADNLSVEQKEKMYAALVEKKGVIPF